MLDSIEYILSTTITTFLNHNETEPKRESLASIFSPSYTSPKNSIPSTIFAHYQPSHNNFSLNHEELNRKVITHKHLFVHNHSSISTIAPYPSPKNSIPSTILVLPSFLYSTFAPFISTSFQVMCDNKQQPPINVVRFIHHI